MALAVPFFPNLFILGTPKSGTSSLHEWLSAHPDIGEGSDKEVRFLLDPEEPLARRDGFHKTGLDGYSAYFPEHLTKTRRYWIDSSPTYYYQRAALETITSRPQVPLMGLLYRRPGERIHSYYQYALNNQNVLPKAMTFEAFLAAVEEGPNGPLKATPGLSNLIEHSDYAKYTEQWLERAPRDRFFFLTFEEVVGEKVRVLRRLCGQLGLDPGFYDNYDFPQENRSVQVRNQGLDQTLRQVARRLTLPLPIRRAVRGVYERFNTKELVRQKDDRTVQLMAELDRRFAPTVGRLEDLTGLDLTAWRV